MPKYHNDCVDDVEDLHRGGPEGGGGPISGTSAKARYELATDPVIAECGYGK
jgi:hypothetical protein